MIALDTDVLAIHHLFTWDSRREVNELVFADAKARLCTTIHNVMELSGLFAVAGFQEKAETVVDTYMKSKEVSVLLGEYPSDWGEYVSSAVRCIGKGLSYGDALIALTLEQSEVESLVTWNKKHFDGKIKLTVETPKEFLERIKLER